MATMTLDADEQAWREHFLAEVHPETEAERKAAEQHADEAIDVVHRQYLLGGCS